MFRCLADEDAKHRWGQIALCIAILFFTVLILCGCDDQAQQIAETNAKIARACTPQLGEERLLRWTVNSEGQYLLYVTIRQPIGRKGNIAQFVIVGEDEIQ